MKKNDFSKSSHLLYLSSAFCLVLHLNQAENKMIQDIHPHQFDNTFVATSEIKENDLVFCFRDNALLMKKTESSPELPYKKDLEECSSNGIFLFTFNHAHCFLVLNDVKPNEEQFVYHDIHFRNPFTQKELDWVTSVALQLKNWYNDHRFCGKCGTENLPSTRERALVCPSCQNTKYPNIYPAIIVAIFNGDQLLLARNANFPDGFYSIIAGYVDVGETIEDAIHREAMEEVGVKIKNIKYYSSQPWPFSGSMMLGFVAEVDGDANIKVDGVEITEASWFDKNNLPNTPPNRSIAGEIIEKFVAGEL